MTLLAQHDISSVVYWFHYLWWMGMQAFGFYSRTYSALCILVFKKKKIKDDIEVSKPRGMRKGSITKKLFGSRVPGVKEHKKTRYFHSWVHRHPVAHTVSCERAEEHQRKGVSHPKGKHFMMHYLPNHFMQHANAFVMKIIYTFQSVRTEEKGKFFTHLEHCSFCSMLEFKTDPRGEQWMGIEEEVRDRNKLN